MTAGIDDVQELSDAYRRASSEGARQLSGSTAEQKILKAVLAASAADSLAWVQERLPRGNEIAKPLEDLVPVLERGNVVGNTLKRVERAALKDATTYLIGLFTGAVKWTWLGVLIMLVGGVFGFAQEAGAALGSWLIPTIVGAPSLLGALVKSFQLAGPAATALGKASGSILDAAGSVGYKAEDIFNAQVRPALELVLPRHGLPLDVPVVGRLRSWAELAVLFAYGVLAVAVVFFCLGVAHAYHAWWSSSCGAGNLSNC